MRVKFNPARILELGIGPEIERNYSRIYRDEESRYHGHMLYEGFEGTVYALKIRGPVRSYYLKEPKAGSYTHFPAIAFDILDPRISRYWECEHKVYNEPGRNRRFDQTEIMTFAIKEWFSEPDFLLNLVEEKEREMAIMNRMAKLMDEEFG